MVPGTRSRCRLPTGGAASPAHSSCAWTPPLQDVQEFKQLGKAITGKEPTDAEVRAQLQRADADGNDKLDLEEWLSFGTVLATMEDAHFTAMIDGFIARIDSAASTSTDKK